LLVYTEWHEQLQTMMRSSRLHISELTLQGNTCDRVLGSHLSSQTVGML
jgi:hypothetical protein